MELRLEKVNKSFGDNHVLKDISFTANSGKPLGFLGRNGAGKTTTIRIIMDVFKYDSGKIFLDGKEFNRKDLKIGYLPEERGLYPNISIQDQLIYFAKLKGMSTSDAKKKASYWVDRFDLNSYYKKSLDTLSKGNQQKIQIIQAIIDDPDILILDEPFTGLDPINARSLGEIILEYVEKNSIVIFSSHQMASVEEYCDEIVMINQGNIVLGGSLKKIKREMSHGFKRIKVNSITNAELKSYLLTKGDFEIAEDKMSLIVKFDLNEREILKILAELDHEIELYSNYEPSLNDIFIEKVGEINE